MGAYDCDCINNLEYDRRERKAQLSKEGTTKDTISRQAALEKVRAMQTYKLFMGDDMILVDKAEVQTELMMLPPVQPNKNDQEFIKLTARYSNGRPYYSIIYLEYDKNGVGHDIVGYSSYSLDVISGYLKKYFMPPAQPEPQEGHWIWVAGDLECSKCHTRYPDLYPDYDNSVACPHCGAKMTK